MNHAIDNDRSVLSAAIQQTILHMPISQAEIGRRIGTSRHAVNRWLNACDLPEAVKLRRLSRLASSFGLDALADLFSSEGKRTLPVPDAFALNCVIDDELETSPKLWATPARPSTRATSTRPNAAPRKR